ncbi:hypothetical protein RFI_27848, partial [Reticulomyxa filosa]
MKCVYVKKKVKIENRVFFLMLDRSSFMFVKYDDLVVVALTRKNANANLVFAFLYELIDVFRVKQTKKITLKRQIILMGRKLGIFLLTKKKKKKVTYFEGEFNEQALRSNFVLVYELLDEVMDHGYPQIVSVDLLKQYIHQGSAKQVQSSNQADANRETRELTTAITGTIPWRQEGKYMYQTNEVYLDVVEEVHAIVNQQGKELSCYCNGKIMMKSSLSGMPICRFGLNDKAVRLTRYDQDKTIMFTPPDGEFELMAYRINKVALPFS